MLVHQKLGIILENKVFHDDIPLLQKRYVNSGLHVEKKYKSVTALYLCKFIIENAKLHIKENK